MRQTTVLIAELATSRGLRAPLAHVADQVFLELARELETQGLSRKVTADMFGMALRSYQRKVQRLQESATDPGRTLWEAVYEFIQSRDVVTRREILERFAGDEESLVRGVLNDLVENAVVFATGPSNDTSFRATTDRELSAIRATRPNAADEIVWALLFRAGPQTASSLASLGRMGVDDAKSSLARLVDSAIAVDDEHVFVAYEAWDGFAGQILAIPKSGGPPVVMAQVLNPLSLAVADGWLYYDQWDDSIEPPANHSIWRIPTGGGTAELVVDSLENPWDYATDGKDLYYSDMNAAHIMRVPVTGGVPTELASGWGAGTGWMTLDGDDVVFEACDDGQCIPAGLYRVPRAGGPVTQIFSADYGRGKISAAPGVLTFGQWILPAGEAPFSVFGAADRDHQGAGAADNDGVFIGDFYTGKIYEYVP